MRIGTTPRHTFILPFGVEQVQKVQIVYTQNGQTILEKCAEDCTLQENTVCVRLTQEETFKFAEGVNVEIQMRAVTTGGDVIGSDVMCVCCDECLSDEVL